MRLLKLVMPGVVVLTGMLVFGQLVLAQSITSTATSTSTTAVMVEMLAIDVRQYQSQIQISGPVVKELVNTLKQIHKIPEQVLVNHTRVTLMAVRSTIDNLERLRRVFRSKVVDYNSRVTHLIERDATNSRIAQLAVDVAAITSQFLSFEAELYFCAKEYKELALPNESVEVIPETTDTSWIDTLSEKFNTVTPNITIDNTTSPFKEIIAKSKSLQHIVFVVTHGKISRNHDPIHTQRGRIQLELLRECVERTPPQIVCGTGKRHKEMIELLGFDNEKVSIRYSSVAGEPDSYGVYHKAARKRDFVYLDHKVYIPQEDYLAMEFSRPLVLNLLKQVPDCTVILSGVAFLYSLGVPAKNAAIYKITLSAQGEVSSVDEVATVKKPIN